MKNYLPYIFAGGIVVLLTVIIITSPRSKINRIMDERTTLKQEDKIPYGTAATKKLLSSLFTQADISVDSKYPGNWDSLDAFKPNQAVIIITDYLDAEATELDRLSRFAAQGNTVFISAKSFSTAAANYYHVSLNDHSYYSSGNDSMQVKLAVPPYSSDSIYTYPGKRYESYFSATDSTISRIIGKNGDGSTNFILLKKGDGHIFLHTAPLAFSNYFILHKNNVQYFEKALSVIPANVERIVWSEYFLTKPEASVDEKGWLNALFQYPSFKWGLLTAMMTLLLFILLGMRRRQRMIPVYEKPKNDSLDFVKTLGRLYHDRGDHKNLASKMATYFLEHVRATYKLPTNMLDEEFIGLLSVKSEYPEQEVRKIIQSIHSLRTLPAVSESQLSTFHQQLEIFYKNT